MCDVGREADKSSSAAGLPLQVTSFTSPLSCPTGEDRAGKTTSSCKSKRPLSVNIPGQGMSQRGAVLPRAPSSDCPREVGSRSFQPPGRAAGLEELCSSASEHQFRCTPLALGKSMERDAPRVPQPKPCTSEAHSKGESKGRMGCGEISRGSEHTTSAATPGFSNSFVGRFTGSMSGCTFGMKADRGKKQK